MTKTEIMDAIQAMSNLDINTELMALVGIKYNKSPFEQYAPSTWEYKGKSIGHWNPCQNRNHAQLVLEKIAEMGFKDDFYECLINDFNLMNRVYIGMNRVHIGWYLLTMPARQICEAALYTVRSAEEVGK